MNKAPAFQFYPDKWQSHTAHLSDTAYRIYHEMICWMWQHSKDQCSIPAKHETIAMLMRRQCDCIANALQEIMHPEMPLLKAHGDKLVSDGLKKEVAKQTKRREGCSESAKARWHKDLPSCERNANAMPTVCSPSPSPSPSPKDLKKEEREPSALESDFNVLWDSYPSKTGRQKAFESWKRWAKAGDKVSEALEGIARYVKYVESARRNGFAKLQWKNGSTFFNQREWKSEWSGSEDERIPDGMPKGLTYEECEAKMIEITAGCV